MADTTFATNAAAGGASFSADADAGSALWPYVKMSFGGSGTQTRVTTAAGLPVQQQSGATFTVVGAAADGAAVSGNPVLVAGFDGTNTQSISVTSGGLVQIHDGAGSLTVDAPVGTPAFVRLSDGSAAITTLPVSLASAPTTAVTLAAGATAIAKAEDVASADADVGVPALAVRKATPANTSGTDGDYEFLQMSAGRLWVSATIDTALPAGTAAIGKLAANDGVDIGDVTINNASGGSAVNIQDGGNVITVDGTVSVNAHDVGAITTSITPGTSAAHLGKAEDAAHGSGDTGVMALAVRRDADTTLADTTGDYAPLQVNASGSLKVAITAGAGSGGTSIADEAAFTIGSTSLTPIGGQYNSTLDSLADGSAGIAHMTVKRAIHVSLRDATTGAEVSVGGGTQYDEDTASADAQKLTMAGVTRADTAASQVNTDGDRSTLIVDASGRLHVNVGNTVTVGSHPVTATDLDIRDLTSASDSVAIGGSALTALQLIDDPVIADDAAFTPATSKVMMAGFEFDDAATDSVDEGDAGAARMSANRNIYTQIRDAAGNERGANVNASNQMSVVEANSASALTSLQLIDDAVFSDDAAFTPGTSKGLAVGFQADESSTDSVDEGDFGVPRMTLDRKTIVTTLPHTTGGLTTFMASASDGSSILVATAQAVKASAGQLYGYYIYNPEAAVTFVHFYNTASASVTVGTTNPLFTVAVPAGAAANLAIPQGIVFSNVGWSVAATTTAGGNTAPATGVSLVAWYA